MWNTINAIYTKGNPVPSILFWELSTAVSEYPGFRVPDFFARMRACDKVAGTRLARRFIDLVTLMVLLFAAVDDAVSEEEAGFVNTCADTLSALCDRDGLEGEKAPLDVKDFVTKKPKAEAPAPGPEEAAPAPAGQAQEEAAGSGGGPARPQPGGAAGRAGRPVRLDKVKADVKSLINLVKVRRLRQEHGLPVPPMSLHLVFMGNPGTGKTTVARLLAKIYHAIGVLSKGQLVEVDRSGLVAGFVGQTAIKTNEVIQKALGGVLFIDEAYALANQDAPNDFGREAIETLLKGMEDHRDNLIVIVAGYTELMATSSTPTPAWRAGSTSISTSRTTTAPSCWRSSSPCVRKMGIRWMIRPRNMPERISKSSTRSGTRTSATPGTCATCSSGRWPASPTGWPSWRTPARRS